jgi:hypothetical protein
LDICLFYCVMVSVQKKEVKKDKASVEEEEEVERGSK